MIAAVNGHNEVVKALVAVGAPVDAEAKNGTTALMLAVLRGNADVVLTLVQSGANTNAQNRRGETALTFAAQSGGVDLIRGAGGQLEHYTPLRQAIIKTLLTFGADPKPLLEDKALDEETRRLFSNFHKPR